MLFTQLEFPIFFLLVLIAAWLCRERTWRNSLLLVASYYFYAYWDYRFCGLLMLSTVVDYFVAQWMAQSGKRSTQRKLLLLSLAVNLGVLGFFKYFNFFIDSARPALQAIGLSGETLDIILPVGVSFYTFQTLSYTIDVYRGVLKPVRRFLDFALYVAFFPQLVAGPIVRARELLPQLATVPTWSKRRMYGGAQQMLRGAVKKVLLADRLGEVVDVVFAGPDLYSGITIWIAVLAYAGQIYYDFSGYSDIAIGAAKMLGYRFPINFRHPYLSHSMSEFWHRWHITLSRWLRDYVYVSLGGNRTGRVATYRNLMITMTLGGLWHGAAWTFVLWGIWHGLALVAERFSKDRNRQRPLPIVGWLLTMSVVLVGWVLFRSESLTEATDILHRMTTLSAGIDWYPPLAIAALCCCIAEHAAWRTRLRIAMRMPYQAWYAPIGTTLMIWALVLYAPRGFRPFVYFQF
ncbi:MAG: MBOAT family O-acyltransferase [Rubripirellula sp.]